MTNSSFEEALTRLWPTGMPRLPGFERQSPRPRPGYGKLAAKTGLDLLNNPDLVNDPRYFLECAVADFVLCGCRTRDRRDRA